MTQVGLIRYATDSISIFHLDTYFDKDAVIQAILSATYLPQQHSNLSSALDLMLTDEVTRARVGVALIGVLISASEPPSDWDQVMKYWLNLRKVGALMLTVGVGSNVDESQLRKITSLPAQSGLSYYFGVEWAGLADNGGIVDAVTKQICSTSVERDCARRAVHVVFVLDSSICSTARPPGDWISALSSVTSVVQGLDISASLNRVGLVTYDDVSATNEIQLHDFQNEVRTSIYLW